MTGVQTCALPISLGLILNQMFTGEVPQGSGHKQIGSVAPKFGYLDAMVERMIRQNPADRPSSLTSVKDELLTSGAEFITRQKLDAVRNTVIPTASPDDPLGGMDVKATGFSYVPGLLTFQLEPAPPPGWVHALVTSRRLSGIRWTRRTRARSSDFGRSHSAGE